MSIPTNPVILYTHPHGHQYLNADGTEKVPSTARVWKVTMQLNTLDDLTEDDREYVHGYLVAYLTEQVEEFVSVFLEAASAYLIEATVQDSDVASTGYELVLKLATATEVSSEPDLIRMLRRVPLYDTVYTGLDNGWVVPSMDGSSIAAMIHPVWVQATVERGKMLSRKSRRRMRRSIRKTRL